MEPSGFDTHHLHGGLGVYLLSLYSVGIVYYGLQAPIDLSLIALVPGSLVMSFTYLCSNGLIDFFAGGRRRESNLEIWEIVGDEHYYESADEEIQSRLDRLDIHSYRRINSIISAILIATSAPFVGVFFFGLPGGLAGVLTSVIVYKLLFRGSIQELNDLAENMAEVYKAKYESQ